MSSSKKNPKFSHSKSQAREMHNAIEKRYRESLNGKFDCLRNVIPSLCRDLNSKDEGESGLARRTYGRYGKQDIIIHALKFIKELEETSTRLCAEVQVLKKTVAAFEELGVGTLKDTMSATIRHVPTIEEVY
jgi:hypothetical protein